MYAAREDLESIDSRSLYWHREQLYCHWGVECPLRFLDIDSADGSDLESADGEYEEDWCRRCICYWPIVRQGNCRDSVIDVLTASSACVASVVRLAYTIDLLYTSDGTYSIIKVGLWK